MMLHLEDCWSLILAVILLSLTTVQSLASIRIQPIHSAQDFGSAPSTLCGSSGTTGRAVGICGLVGAGYTLSSAPDFLAAARCQHFQLSATAMSSDPNVMGIVADHVLSSSKSTSRLDVGKALTGVTQVSTCPFSFS